MKKILSYIMFLILLFPLKVFAEEYVTVTYYANDGSGRSKTVEMVKGSEYTSEGGHIFVNANNDSTNPINDKYIDLWNTEPDGSGSLVGAGYTYESSNPNTTGIYDLFNNSSTVSLYAQWEGRQDISSGVTFTVTGNAIVPNGDGTYTYNYDQGFAMAIKLVETSRLQFNRLVYFKLPDYYLEYLNNKPEVRAYYERVKPFTIRIIYSGQEHRANCYYYLLGDTIYVDMLEDGSYANHLVENATNLSINFTFWLTIESREVNGRILLVEILNTNHSTEAEEIYPKGTITVKYIDVDTGEEIESTSTSDVLGVVFSPEALNIEGYELVEQPNANYSYEDYEQVIIYKYRKLSNSVETTEDNNSQKENPNTGAGISIISLMILLVVSIGILLLSKKFKRHIRAKS